MRGANNRGWNRTPHIERSEARDEDIHVITNAEFYLLVGKDARRRLRRGCRPESTGRSHRLPAADIFTARSFADSSNAFILRALVEEWSWPQIKAGLDEQNAASTRQQHTC